MVKSVLHIIAEPGIITVDNNFTMTTTMGYNMTTEIIEENTHIWKSRMREVIKNLKILTLLLYWKNIYN